MVSLFKHCSNLTCAPCKSLLLLAFVAGAIASSNPVSDAAENSGGTTPRLVPRRNDLRSSPSDVRLSPDGTKILTVTASDQFNVWDVATRQELPAIRASGISRGLQQMGFNEDSNRIWLFQRTFWQRSVVVFDAASGIQLRRFKIPRLLFPRTINVTEDGRIVFAVNSKHELVRYDVASGQLLTQDRQEDVAPQTDLEAKPRVTWHPLINTTKQVLSLDAAVAAGITKQGKILVWDVVDNRQLHELGEGESPVIHLRITPDGSRIVAVDSKNNVHVWDRARGTLVKKWLLDEPCKQVRISPGGDRVATLSQPTTAPIMDASIEGDEFDEFDEIDFDAVVPPTHVVLWVADTGKKVATIAETSAGIGQVEFGIEGNRLVTILSASSYVSSLDDTETPDNPYPKVWDSETGEPVCQFSRPDGLATRARFSLAMSTDGNFMALGREDGTLQLWDLKVGRETRTVQAHEKAVFSLAFSSDTRILASGSDDGAARLWDVPSLKSAGKMPGNNGVIYGVRFFRDDKMLAVFGNLLVLYDVAQRAPAHQLNWMERVPWNWIMELAESGSDAIKAGERRPLSDDAKKELEGTDRAISILEQRTTESIERELAGEPPEPDEADADDELVDDFGIEKLFVFSDAMASQITPGISADGTRLLVGGQLWDIEAGKFLKHVYQVGREYPAFCAFTEGGKKLLHAFDELRCQETATDEPSYKVRLPYVEVRSRFNEYGDFADVVPLPSGESPLYRKDRMLDSLAWVTVSPDDTLCLIHSPAGAGPIVCEVSTGKLLCVLNEPEMISSAAFSADGRRIITAADNAIIRIWDSRSGKELCRLLTFLDGGWAVVDYENRYDASNGGDVDGLYWLIGEEQVALEQLKDRYFEPGLLAKLMGLNPEPLRAVKSFDDPKLFPQVHVQPPTTSDPKLAINLRNRGGGIGRVVVKVNGKELTQDARGPRPDPSANEVQLELDLQGDRRIRPGERNLIEVQAYNAEGYLRSRGLQVAFDAPGELLKESPDFWAIVCGVSDYRGDAVDLRFAAKDANDFAGAVRIAASRLFGDEHIHVTTLTDLPNNSPDGAPTRANLLSALESLVEQTEPKDVVVIYLAGHGVNFGGSEGDFYYLLQEADRTDLTDPEIRKQVAISSTHVSDILSRIPATKQVMILDTCAAGRMIEMLTAKREIPSSQIRAMERMKDRAGLHVLAGCAADRVSYEASRYGQGLLTYSLLLGMRGAALRDEQFVDVTPLFGFAADQVPQLARDIGGVQRPMVASPRGGGSFDIGQLVRDDRQAIPLAKVRPLVLRARFQDDRRLLDHLRLSMQVNARLRDQSSDRGGGARLVFVDAEELPDAWTVVGRYKTSGNVVEVEARLFQGEQELAQFQVEGSTEDIGSIADEIVENISNLSVGD